MTNQKVPAVELANSIDERIKQCENHLYYVEHALHQAIDYSRGLFNVEIDPALLEEAEQQLPTSSELDQCFAIATELALNIRRAGDIALNNHYG